MEFLFEIESIDPLGQGVFKKDGEVFFIPKTLPGDIGLGKVWKKSKGVHFANLIELKTLSPLRRQPACPHFKDCNGCHFLHTSYEHELNFKKQSLEKLFSKISYDLPIKITPSERREHYRNRIQLHYDRNKKVIGFLNKKRILPITECLLPEADLLPSFKRFINQDWLSLSSKENTPKRGHVELYLTQENEVQIAWNQKYAAGGFTQVHRELNKKLIDLTSEVVEKNFSENYTVLDLFGGNGNLSRNLTKAKHKFVFDFYQKKPENSLNTSFIHQDLFKDDLYELEDSIDLMIVDPPRSGFKGLETWLSHYRPKQLIYISCNPATLARDVFSMPEGYKIQDFHLIDLFPGTYHFETFISFSRID